MRSCPAEITPRADVTDVRAAGGCIKPDALRARHVLNAPLATRYFRSGTAFGTIARVKVRVLEFIARHRYLFDVHAHAQAEDKRDVRVTRIENPILKLNVARCLVARATISRVIADKPLSLLSSSDYSLLPSLRLIDSHSTRSGKTRELATACSIVQ